MNDPRMTMLRKELLADVVGDILEIGFGTCLNLPHYPEHVRRITTVDPDPGMSKMARTRITVSLALPLWPRPRDNRDDTHP
jgi:hypothetical protein